MKPRVSLKVLTVLLISAIVLIAGGGFVQLLSTNQVSNAATNYRWEPSSSVCFSNGTCPPGASWVTSWNDINLSQSSYPAYTASWTGSYWTSFLQQMNGHDTGDLFLTWNPAQGLHSLTLLDITNCSLGYRKSTDASGSNWNAPNTVLSHADYPSLAAATGGTLVIGFNQTDTNCAYVYGFQTMVSSNGGTNWGGPYSIPNLTGSQAFGRIVASGNTFHYIFVDTSADPTYVLKDMQSSDGMNWSTPTTLDTYTKPAKYSPDTYCDSSGHCGRVHYATNIDVAATSGLGWVVLYPVARPDNPSINNMKFCAQNLSGCTSISYSTDLFAQGITTSPNGDIWFEMLTYSGAPNRTLPLVQVASYREANGNYISGTLNTNIIPTSWRFMASTGRCDNNNCFALGDYERPAVNGYTGATLPFIQQSSQQTDLMQSFVQDPQSGLPPVQGLQFGPIQPFGSDNQFKGTIPAELATQRPDTGTSISFLLGK